MSRPVSPSVGKVSPDSSSVQPYCTGVVLLPMFDDASATACCLRSMRKTLHVVDNAVSGLVMRLFPCCECRFLPLLGPFFFFFFFFLKF